MIVTGIYLHHNKRVLGHAILQCETDFAVKGLSDHANELAKIVVGFNPYDIDDLLEQPSAPGKVRDYLKTLNEKFGENIKILGFSRQVF